VTGLTREELRHLGRLAQLELGEGDLDHLEGELSRIVGYVEMLAGVDVTGVEPLAQPIDLGTVTRADDVLAAETHEAVLGVASHLEDGMYVVPPVLQVP
jgi:aspartyl-tRNA(Asn)/glutamyl-tRNA(Gln) amidotransferase subunit C